MVICELTGENWRTIVETVNGLYPRGQNVFLAPEWDDKMRGWLKGLLESVSAHYPWLENNSRINIQFTERQIRFLRHILANAYGRSPNEEYKRLIYDLYAILGKTQDKLVQRGEGDKP